MINPASNRLLNLPLISQYEIFSYLKWEQIISIVPMLSRAHYNNLSSIQLKQLIKLHMNASWILAFKSLQKFRIESLQIYTFQTYPEDVKKPSKELKEDDLLYKLGGDLFKNFKYLKFLKLVDGCRLQSFGPLLDNPNPNIESLEIDPFTNDITPTNSLKIWTFLAALFKLKELTWRQPILLPSGYKLPQLKTLSLIRHYWHKLDCQAFPKIKVLNLTECQFDCIINSEHVKTLNVFDYLPWEYFTESVDSHLNRPYNLTLNYKGNYPVKLCLGFIHLTLGTKFCNELTICQDVYREHHVECLTYHNPQYKNDDNKVNKDDIKDITTTKPNQQTTTVRKVHLITSKYSHLEPNSVQLFMELPQHLLDCGFVKLD